MTCHLMTCRAQRVGFFSIGSGRVGYWKKYRVAGRVGSGRSVEIYDRVFSGIFFTLGYFRVFLGISGYFWVFPGISGYIGYHLFFLEVVSQTLRFFLTLQKFTNNLQIKITVGQIQGKWCEK